MRKISKLLLILTFVYLGITYLLSGLIVKVKERRNVAASVERMQERFDIDLTAMLDLLPTPEEISFQTDDGLELKGWWIAAPSRPDSLPSKDCAVIMAHGYTDNRSGTLKYAQLFQDCGCNLLMYDHRGHGESEGSNITGGVKEAKDLRTAHRWLLQRTGFSPQQVGWLGESWGAATALQAAASYDSVAFVIAESPFEDWRTAITERTDRDFGKWLRAFFPGTFGWARIRNGVALAEASPLKAAQDISVPTLIFHSLTDAETSCDQSQHIYDALPDSTPKQIELLDWGSIHAHNIIDQPAQYQELVLAFLQQEASAFCR